MDQITIFKARAIRTMDPNCPLATHVAVAAGRKIPGKTLGWMQQFAKQYGSNFLCTEFLREGKAYSGDKRRFAIGAADFVEDVTNWEVSGYPFLLKPATTGLVVDGKVLRNTFA